MKILPEKKILYTEESPIISSSVNLKSKLPQVSVFFSPK
jgi:hypothetical protein